MHKDFGDKAGKSCSVLLTDKARINKSHTNDFEKSSSAHMAARTSELGMVVPNNFKKRTANRN